MRERILIGGASLAGKSSLAAELASETGWDIVATDFLARHPGRPWRDDGTSVARHVVEHFLSLAPDELLADVLRHYRSLAARIREIADGNSQVDFEGTIIEGSAVLPELASELRSTAHSCFLIAERGLLTRRIIQLAGAENEAAMKFAARAELMNDFIAEEARRLELPIFKADEDSAASILARIVAKPKLPGTGEHP